jgi:hypothetical protein
MSVMLVPQTWARREFSQADLGDSRRTERLVKYAAAAAADPSSSIPRQCGHWKDTKAAYRLFDMPQVSFDAVAQPHWQSTCQRAAACQTVLLVNDTTTLSFDHHPATTGLGPTTHRGRGLGLLMHSTLAVDVSAGAEASPPVLGMACQQTWVRPAKPPSAVNRNQQKKKGKRNQVPESAKWARSIEAVGPLPQTRLVHAADAESDCWEALEACRQQQQGFVIRVCQDRNVIAGHGAAEAVGSPLSLLELARKAQPLGGKRLWVRSRPNREPRWAKLLVSATSLTVLAPRNWPDKPHRKGHPRPRPLACWCVRVWEIQTPKGEQPIEWVLLSDEPAEDLESALRVAFWYSCRWLVEEYHKCLKTGCRMEERQLEDVDRLEPLLGVLSIVAVRLLQLKHQAKSDPQAPAESVVPRQYVQTLAAWLKLSKPEQITARQFWREVAKMGGFLGRRGDGDPGWLTLWRGWQQLETLTIGMQLARRRTRCG